MMPCVTTAHEAANLHATAYAHAHGSDSIIISSSGSSCSVSSESRLPCNKHKSIPCAVDSLVAGLSASATTCANNSLSFATPLLWDSFVSRSIISSQSLAATSSSSGSGGSSTARSYCTSGPPSQGSNKEGSSNVGSSSSSAAATQQQAPPQIKQQDKNQTSASTSSSSAAAAAAGTGSPQATPGTEPPQQKQGPQTPKHEDQSSPKAASNNSSNPFLVGTLSQEELWVAAVHAKTKIWANKEHPELKDKADEFAAQVRQHYKALFEQYCKKYTNLTPQAESQLKLVCLAIATYRVLMPHLRDEAQLDAHLMETLGGLFTPFFMGSMKVSNWFRVAVLRQSPVTLATGTLENICQDMASACDCKVEAVDDSAEMVIMSCMFQEVLTQEGLPQLLRHFCCQHNIMWLDAYKPHGLLASLEKSKAKGDDVCVIKVYKEK
eukprot:jgi/Chrzof1/10291/Cz04g36050.t1